MTAAYRIDSLGSEHDREAFDCGVEPLNRYLKETARQDERKLVSRCFAACPAESMTIAGYYTLSSAEVPTNALPEAISRKLPRYPSTPVARSGRLAVDNRYRGQGLGSTLVVDAVMRALKSDLAAFALVVDAKNEAAVAFYEHTGFFVLDSAKSVLMLPLANLRSKLGLQSVSGVAIRFERDLVLNLPNADKRASAGYDVAVRLSIRDLP